MCPTISIWVMLLWVAMSLCYDITNENAGCVARGTHVGTILCEPCRVCNSFFRLVFNLLGAIYEHL